MYRTTYCGTLTEASVGKSERVCGWIFHKRDMGGIIFIDLRDREGTLQTVFNANALPEEQFRAIETAKPETVIMADGVIRIRDKETYNPRLKTGTIELAVTNVEILSPADTLPFALEDGTQVREDIRLEYRYLDIRRTPMQNALRFRHEVASSARRFLDGDGFIEVETPMLTKSTPEGARDYLVPSRVHPGEFYALPQSPQIFKQLLMVGGIDKYYQVARCFRDEDLRADRQPEFTQLDMELSFATQEEILQKMEALFKHILREVKGIDIKAPFPRITWSEAMDRYGSDKPDLRFELPIVDLTDIADGCSFSVFRSVVKKGGVVRAINIKQTEPTRAEIDRLTERALSYGAKGMAWIMLHRDGSVNSILQKYFTEGEWDSILKRTCAEPGDFILFCADKLSAVRRTLGGLRLDIADMFGLRAAGYSFLIVTDFPEFEYSEKEKRYVAAHHPFTMPYPEDVQYLLTDPKRVRAQAYDFVLNGVELGSGSIRIHDREIQRRMFMALGLEETEIQERFGFMLKAFSFGTPPHGGFAFGLDRFVMLLLGADSIRSVIAFPKTKDASCLMTGAPDHVSESQLRELSLSAFSEGEDAVPSKNGVRRPRKAPVFNVPAVAKLAGLSLTEDESEKMRSKLGAMISFADLLGDADLENEQETSTMLRGHNVFREDEAERSDCRKLLAPLKTVSFSGETYFQVPKAIE